MTLDPEHLGKRRKADRTSRRAALKRIGAGAAIAWSAPILTSLQAPAFAQYFFDCDFGPCTCLPGADVCGRDEFGDCACAQTMDRICRCAQLPDICGEPCFSDGDCACPNCYCFRVFFCHDALCRDEDPGTCRALCHTP